MAQLTLYIDEETEVGLKQAAAAAGKSQSRWVTELIRERIADEWPEAVRQLLGSWSDFPTAEEIREGTPPDLPREPL